MKRIGSFGVVCVGGTAHTLLPTYFYTPKRLWTCAGVCFKLLSLAQMLQYANKRNSSHRQQRQRMQGGVRPEREGSGCLVYGTAAGWITSRHITERDFCSPRLPFVPLYWL